MCVTSMTLICFTAVQAAQKCTSVSTSPFMSFTAVQAAQKIGVAGPSLFVPFTAVQAAQKEVTLRKPVSGELRGVSLMELANMDVLALRKVLPRISSPSLTDVEVGRMDPADLMQCGVAVASFLLTKKARQASLEA